MPAFRRCDVEAAAMILLTGFYRDPEPARHAEFLECIRRNALNEFIEQIHLLVERPADPLEVVQALPLALQPKLRFAAETGRLTFEQLFTYANLQLVGRRVIVANADIYFDASLRRLGSLDLRGAMLCLSRWDVQPDGSTRFIDMASSQDAWIFEAPIPALRCNFPVGQWGCDNRLAWEAQRIGLVLSNPSRSVRANHLHLSGVSRHPHQGWLQGPTREVSIGHLEAPWLWFVLPALSGTTDIGATISSLAGQAAADCIVVDAAAAGLPMTWLPGHHGRVSVVGAPLRLPTTPGLAWNFGAAAVDETDVICFITAGAVPAPGFSQFALQSIAPDCFLFSDDGSQDALVCTKPAFTSVGGFDTRINDADAALAELRSALHRARLEERGFPAAMVAGQRRADATTLSASPREALARVSFHETTGCTVERLALGVSSHVNELRPFAAVPDILLGRAFTSVVANRASPIEVRFLQAGRLYVLVGTDWEGYHRATAWLGGVGTKEDLRPATTTRGTGFEIWSLSAEANDSFVIPTQVVLVGDRLVRVA
jgi:hypothetical protein